MMAMPRKKVFVELAKHKKGIPHSLIVFLINIAIVQFVYSCYVTYFEK